MTHQLSQLQPQAVWDYFYQLTQVPRPSKHEDKIQAFMLDFGRSLGLKTHRDEVGNIIIKKPATAGYENRQGVVLQAHLDMVPQANNDTPHDFVNDPISAIVDGEWVCAQGTTLGADNGIGVAAIMAVLADNTLEHGAIEALFTCDEETSMAGAFALNSDELDGDILLNLDSEEEKELCIGCAGGVDAVAVLPIQRQALVSGKQLYQLTLKGLKGGHSGVDIALQRGNANKLLARCLTLLDIDWQLLSFNGGNMRNAIPREANAVIAVAADNQAQLDKHLSAFQLILAKEYGGVEADIQLSAQAISKTADNIPQHGLTANSQKTLLNTLMACPDGVCRMSLDMEGLVETSSNLAIVTTDEAQVTVEYLLRSSVDSVRDALAAQITAVFELAGAGIQFIGAYPGWKPNPQSAILQVMKTTGKQLFGKTPKVHAIHAGLECGILGGTYPHWDMISFGPTIRFPHSPDEKVYIPSVEGFYQWLLLTLTAVPQKNS
ncbi:MAG: cytosol nonspecific dipeptidase [Gammaproteobacteria bacterium]|nr:MAG: cytosol nonspecific dipeptidase [Gammaproteobacteria bacterium]